MSITLANRIFQLTYISHIDSLKIKTFPMTSILFLHLFLLISTPFPVKPPMHFTIWVHSCMYMSEQSLSFLMKTLPKHSPSTPQALLLFRNHSISRNLTISISQPSHSFHYWWPSLQIVLTSVILLNVSKSILLSWVSMNIAFYVLKNGKIDVCWSEWSPYIPLKSQSEGYKISKSKNFFATSPKSSQT